jgi:thiol-disulfide isomerase/thioredoxin
MLMIILLEIPELNVRRSVTPFRAVRFPTLVLTMLPIGFICAAAFTGCSQSKGNDTNAQVSSPRIVNSVAKDLEQFKGKVIFLNLWATWCPPCRVEIPSLVNLQRKYGDKGLAVVGVSLDPVDPRGGGGAAAVAPFVQKAGINYSVWMIEDYEALKDCPMGLGYPTTYLIGRDGRVLRRYVGAESEETFENDVKLALRTE